MSSFSFFGSLLHCSFFVLVFISCGREYVGFGVCLFCLFVYYVVFSADLVLYVIFLPSVRFYGCERPIWFCCFLFVFSLYCLHSLVKGWCMAIGVRDLSLNCAHFLSSLCTVFLFLGWWWWSLVGVRDLIYQWVVIFPLLSFHCSLSLH